jgi:hypothetical protein
VTCYGLVCRTEVAKGDRHCGHCHSDPAIADARPKLKVWTESNQPGPASSGGLKRRTM